MSEVLHAKVILKLRPGQPPKATIRVRKASGEVVDRVLTGGTGKPLSEHVAQVLEEVAPNAGKREESNKS